MGKDRKGNMPHLGGQDALQEGKIDEDLDAVFAEEESKD